MEGKKDYQRSKRLTRFSLLTAWMVALTMDDVFQRHTVHQNQRQILTNFYYGNRMKKESKTNILFNNRIQDQMASAERRFVSGAGKKFFSEVDCLSKLQQKQWRWVSVRRNINDNGGE